MKAIHPLLKHIYTHQIEHKIFHVILAGSPLKAHLWLPSRGPQVKDPGYGFSERLPFHSELLNIYFGKWEAIEEGHQIIITYKRDHWASNRQESTGLFH